MISSVILYGYLHIELDDMMEDDNSIVLSICLKKT